MLAPPDSVAVSVIEVPTGPPAAALVLNVGLAFEIVTCSLASVQLVSVTALLFGSPE